MRVVSPLAASEISEPEPDVSIIRADFDQWSEHPTRAVLVVEVALGSVLKQRLKAALYALAEVDEYWIVNHVEGVVEVYRDRHNGEWRQRTTHQRGEAIRMVAFPDVEVVISEILPPV